MEYSLRQAITPTGNWVVGGWYNVDVNHNFAWLNVVNPGAAPVSVTIERVQLSGASLGSQVVEVAPRGGVRWSAGTFDQYVTLYIRCAQPVMITAIQHHGAGKAYPLTAHPLPPG